MRKIFSSLFLLGLIFLLVIQSIGAQESTPPADCVNLSVTTIEPEQLTQGREGNFRINGAGFSSTTKASLRGFGNLSITSLSANALVVAVPANVPLGRYDVLVEDSTFPLCAAVSVPILRLVAANVPQPTAIPPTAFPTLAPPTPIPGQPSLIVSQYSATPTTVRQGGVVSFTITVLNQGNRTAENVTAAFENSGALVPSGSQTSAILPNIPAGGSTSFVLSAIASTDVSSGTNNISLNFNYRDFENNNYTNQAVLSVDVESVAQISQLTLRGYSVNPDPVQPAEEVILELTLTNTGTETASQLQLTVPIGSGVLLAGPLGNSFPLGSIPPRTDIIATLPLIVSSTAPAGVQSQPLTISYIQDGSPQTAEINITLTVDTPLSSSILLESYTIGRDNVQAGDRFTLSARLSNVGTAPVQEALVTFRSTPTSTNNNDTSNTSLFAPLGGGGSLFLGDIAADSTVTFSQEFIVSGTADSGIYSLPILVRYRKADGTMAEDTLNASIVVLVPPLLRFIEQQPVPEIERIGNTVTLSLSIQNIGQRDVRLLSARIITENLEILTGEETLLQVLRSGEETLLEASLIPNMEGEGRIQIELSYLDDLNQEATLVQEYIMQILAAPPAPPPDRSLEQQPLEDFSTPEPEGIVLPEDFWGRLLLGFFGIGN
jgi:hypothetical protein